MARAPFVHLEFWELADKVEAALTGSKVETLHIRGPENRARFQGFTLHTPIALEPQTALAAVEEALGIMPGQLEATYPKEGDVTRLKIHPIGDSK